jgi:hypothetical protein
MRRANGDDRPHVNIFSDWRRTVKISKKDRARSVQRGQPFGLEGWVRKMARSGIDQGRTLGSLRQIVRHWLHSFRRRVVLNSFIDEHQ